MLINPESWHYKAYRFSYNLWEDGAPRRTNLCQYMRRLMFLPAMMVAWLVMNVVGWFFYSLAGIVSLFIGYYPTFDFEGPSGAFEKYPTPTFLGARVVPAHVILLAIAIFAHYEAIIQHFWILFIVEGLVVGTVLLTLGFFWVSHLMDDSKYPSVIKEYVLAKKSRFCPTVEFDHPAPTQVEAPVVPIDKQT